MPRHPFAAVQYVRNSLSTDTLGAWLRPETRPEDVPPVPPLPDRTLSRNQSLPPAPTRVPRGIGLTRPRLDSDVPAVSSRSSPGHFVKHSSKVTLLLSGQEDGTAMPEYNTGGTIDGILAVSRPSGLLALEVTVCMNLPFCAQDIDGLHRSKGR